MSAPLPLQRRRVMSRRTTASLHTSTASCRRGRSGSQRRDAQLKATSYLELLCCARHAALLHSVLAGDGCLCEVSAQGEMRCNSIQTRAELCEALGAPNWRAGSGDARAKTEWRISGAALWKGRRRLCRYRPHVLRLSICIPCCKQRIALLPLATAQPGVGSPSAPTIEVHVRTAVTARVATCPLVGPLVHIRNTCI